MYEFLLMIVWHLGDSSRLLSCKAAMPLISCNKWAVLNSPISVVVNRNISFRGQNIFVPCFKNVHGILTLRSKKFDFFWSELLFNELWVAALPCWLLLGLTKLTNSIALAWKLDCFDCHYKVLEPIQLSHINALKCMCPGESQKSHKQIIEFLCKIINITQIYIHTHTDIYIY